MALTVSDCLTAIERHTRALAAAAEGNLDARIEHCPDWSMADLVWHLASVHWFWENVARLLPTEAPDDLVRPERPASDELVPTLLANMEALLVTLGAADQQAPCWTWGLEENVGFITRHQVQEAAVHHWDAAHAAGAGWEMDPVVAMDAVDEFLTHSVANTRWPAENAEPLGGRLLFCTSADDGLERTSWEVVDGEPGTLRHATHRLIDRVPAAESSARTTTAAPTFLLWLYRRVPDEALPWEGDLALLDRFRAFTNTD